MHLSRIVSLTLTDNVEFQYKCDNYYNKDSEGAIYCFDPNINITWPQFVNFEDIRLSEKDNRNRFLEEIDNPF